VSVVGGVRSLFDCFQLVLRSIRLLVSEVGLFAVEIYQTFGTEVDLFAVEIYQTFGTEVDLFAVEIYQTLFLR
jgi:hypothetical protein